MPDECVFCALDASRIIDSDELVMAVRDAYPVTHLHTLIIPRRHVADYFDLGAPERLAVENMLAQQRQMIQAADPTAVAFNVGVNAGREAGQTVFHVHIHLIPRRAGDVADPRGGVRGVIPHRQKY